MRGNDGGWDPIKNVVSVVVVTFALLSLHFLPLMTTSYSIHLLVYSHEREKKSFI